MLEKIGGLRVLIEIAGLILLNPHSDQVSADVVSFGEPMKGLAREELLSDLAFELDAVWTCPAFVESVFDFTLPALRTEAG